MTIPDSLSIGGAFLGILAIICFSETDQVYNHLFQSLMALVIASGTLFWVAILAELLLKKEALGLGDIIFAGTLGIFIGPKLALYPFFGACFLAFVWIIIYSLLAKFLKKENPYKLGKALPFAPWMCLAVALYFFFHRTPFFWLNL